MGQDREVGTMRSSRGGLGLAVLRLDALGGPLTVGGQALRCSVPGWAVLPELV